MRTVSSLTWSCSVSLEAVALGRAVTYRGKKIKPLFIEMKNKIGAMSAQVKEPTRERGNWNTEEWSCKNIVAIRR